MTKDIASYNRSVLITILVSHWRMSSSECACGWGVLGASHPVHVADMYEQMVPFHRGGSGERQAGDAAKSGQGICRTCLEPIWNEGGTVGRSKRQEGWSDRNERGGDSLVCFKAIVYRHVPLTGREAAIYDHAYSLGSQRVGDSR